MRDSSLKNENPAIVYLFQTCVSFSLLLSTIEYILKNVCNQTFDSSH